jgi:predicted Zn-dependent protease
MDQLGRLLVMVTGVAGRSSQMAAAMINEMTQLKYSRSDESEADGTVLAYMAEAGFDPSEMLGVMKTLKESTRRGGTPSEILSTHALPENHSKQGPTPARRGVGIARRR